jgi:hypothetical protein
VILNITIGAGSAHAGTPVAGGDTVVTATGMSTFTATGNSADSTEVVYSYGGGAGSQTYNSITYVGGTAQTVGHGNGIAPGGGGAGGTLTYGGNGAPGALWVVFRQ